MFILQLGNIALCEDAAMCMDPCMAYNKPLENRPSLFPRFTGACCHFVLCGDSMVAGHKDKAFVSEAGNGCTTWEGSFLLGGVLPLD